MTAVRPLVVPSSVPSSAPGEPESLEQLIGDCRRMAARWRTPARRKPSPVTPAGLHGVTVPAASAQVVDEMAEYAE